MKVFLTLLLAVLGSVLVLGQTINTSCGPTRDACRKSCYASRDPGNCYPDCENRYTYCVTGTPWPSTPSPFQPKPNKHTEAMRDLYNNRDQIAKEKDSPKDMTIRPQPASLKPLNLGVPNAKLSASYDAQLKAAKAARAATTSAQKDEQVLVCEVAGAGGARFLQVMSEADAAVHGPVCHYVSKSAADKAGLGKLAVKPTKDTPPGTKPLFKSGTLGKLNDHIKKRRESKKKELSKKKTAKPTKAADKKAKAAKAKAKAAKGKTGKGEKLAKTIMVDAYDGPRGGVSAGRVSAKGPAVSKKKGAKPAKAKAKASKGKKGKGALKGKAPKLRPVMLNEDEGPRGGVSAGRVSAKAAAAKKAPKAPKAKKPTVKKTAKKTAAKKAKAPKKAAAKKAPKAKKAKAAKKTKAVKKPKAKKPKVKKPAKKAKASKKKKKF